MNEKDEGLSHEWGKAIPCPGQKWSQRHRWREARLSDLQTWNTDGRRIAGVLHKHPRWIVDAVVKIVKKLDVSYAVVL
jgi:hypothetical protein